MVSDLKTKLKLFMEMTQLKKGETFLGVLLELTKENQDCYVLAPYFSNPEKIDTITESIFSENKTIVKNLPIILSDMKEYLLQRLEEFHDLQSSDLKSAVVSFANSCVEFRSGFISKNWTKVAKRQIEVPHVQEITSADLQAFFRTKRAQLLQINLERLSDSKIGLGHMSDFNKVRGQKNIEWINDLPVPLPKGKYGNKHINPVVQAMIDNNAVERIPYVRVLKE